MGNIDQLLRRIRQPSRNDAATFITWAREHAVMVESLDESGDVEKLSFLDELLENKRVVYLGEEDHWIHEKTDYRLLLLRYLVSRGWRYVGEELGFSDGLQIDHYTARGK